MADMGKLRIIRFNMMHQIWRDQFCDFWPNHSEVLCKNMHFSYLLTTRGHCTETLQVASGYACYNIHQVWSQYAKPLRRYSLITIFACFFLNSFACYSRTFWIINLNSITFCQHGLKMIWANFGEKRTNCLGRDRKSTFFEYLKIEKKLNLAIFEFWGSIDLAWAKDSEKNIMFLLYLMVQTLLADIFWKFGQMVALESWS